MTAQIVPLRRRCKTGTVDLDDLEARLRAAGVARISEYVSETRLTQIAVAELQAEGVVLEGDKSAIDALVRLKTERVQEQLCDVDVHIEASMQSKQKGRPAKHSVLRDLLVFSLHHTNKHMMKVCGPASKRQAQNKTAKMLNLTSSTRLQRSSRQSGEQVREAVNRTLAKFELVEKSGFAEIALLAYISAMAAIHTYTAETNNRAPDDLRTFMEAEASKLLPLCRLLAFAAHLDRSIRSP